MHSNYKIFQIPIYLVFTLFLSSVLYSQNYKERLKQLDIENYKISIALNDSTDIIDATTEIEMRFRNTTDSFYLDLNEKDSISGKGMKVDSIFQNQISVDFEHKNDKLIIKPKHIFPNLTYTYKIKYSGIPNDGLIISKNLMGSRTFFADNWPNRAHNWFPCVDHPSDKATVEFIVSAPEKYQVIANGLLINKLDLNNNYTQYHWKTNKLLSTKIMVIGVAEFAVKELGEIDSIPVTNWVYKKNKKKGFHDFANAKEILKFFIDTIAEFPFKKLANIQSTTYFGGMENASAIFYSENLVNGKREFDDIIAHEIAHQWFGDTVTETDWAHLWLSEGFATYLTDLYILHSEGNEEFQERLKDERKTVLNFYKNTKTPVVDTKTKNYLKLLNPNSYQKGGWVLHMLRRKLGDEIFYKGIRNFYEKYKFKNASTNSFKIVMEQTSGQDLDVFFKQWLIEAGHPILKFKWLKSKDKIHFILTQTQDRVFEFPLDIEIVYEDGSSEIKTVDVKYSKDPFVIETKGKVKDINFDPNIWLLFDLAE